MPQRSPFFRRWFERAAVLVVLLLIGVVIAACWMPAVVGPSEDRVPRRAWRNR